MRSDEIDSNLLVMYTHSLGEEDPMQGQSGAAVGNNQGYGKHSIKRVGHVLVPVGEYDWLV